MPIPEKGTPEYDAWIKARGAKISAAKLAQHRTHTPEARAKMSAARKGKKQSPESIEKRRQSLIGKKRSPEVCAAISERFKKNPPPRWGNRPSYVRTPEHRARVSEQNRNRSPELKAKLIPTQFKKGLVPYNKGIPRTEEQKRQHSEKIKGRKVPPEESARRIASLKAGGYRPSEETRRKISKSNMGRPFVPLALERSMGARKDSSIEIAVAEELNRRGIIYEKQHRIGRYWIDFFIPAENRAIEVNGCFWHYCPECGFDGEKRTERWEKDSRRYEILQEKGYTVTVLWEHDIRKGVFLL